jgi:hypothetical protein
MANSGLRIGLLLTALGGCDAGGDGLAKSTVTVKLPVARPAEPAPGFSFQGSKATAAAKAPLQ